MPPAIRFSTIGLNHDHIYGMTNAVKNWISERRENSLAEKDSTGRQVFAWHQLPDSSSKPA